MKDMEFFIKEAESYQVKFDLLQDINYEVGARYQEVTQDFPRHTHDYIEFVYMVQGRSVQIINDQKRTLKKGEMVIIPKGEYHENIKATEDDIVLNIFITNRFLNSLIIKSGFDNLLINFKHALEHKKINKVFNFKLEQKILNVLNKINTYVESKEEFYLSLYNMILEWLLEFIFYLKKEKIINIKENSNFNLMTYIIKNLKTASLKEFSDLNYRSSSSMSLKIKNEYKMSFMEIVHKVRLDKFVKLITVDNQSITESMYEVGYQNKTYFYKIFKDEFKMTPHDFIVKYTKIKKA
ncbi:MAG: AraC family transcriptional regulator [Mycoplasmatales bacterium]